MLTFNQLTLKSAVTASAPAKTITLGSATANEVLYTVPTGRKFSGQAWGNSTATGAVQINSVTFNFAGQTNNITPLVLAAGAVVVKSSTPWVYIVGVEEDA
jgi:hypothetical protein